MTRCGGTQTSVQLAHPNLCFLAQSAYLERCLLLRSRIADREICRQIEMSPMYWYKIEAEEVKALPEETLRTVENILGIDLGVKFD
ncbi:MAG: hypothetical protein AAFO04_18400 [Cyanobacteria bacterium J06592_8]